jgi:hypothetical protein
MGTRSTIALEYADGTIGQIYCHWDGYLDHNGKILFVNYTDPFKVRELLDGGDMSSLSETVEGCSFYALYERGETCPQRMYKDYAEFRKEAQGEEYNYILRRDGNWYVEFYGEFDGLLNEAFAFQAEQEEME